MTVKVALTKNKPNTDTDTGNTEKDAPQASSEQETASFAEFAKRILGIELTEHQKAVVEVFERQGKIRIILTRGELK